MCQLCRPDTYYIVSDRLNVELSGAAFCVHFRVEAPVTRRSPHRSGREDFPHPVPRFQAF